MFSNLVRTLLFSIIFVIATVFGEESCHTRGIEVQAVFLVDGSGSVDENDFQICLKFVAEFVRFIGNLSDTEQDKSNNEIAVFQFSNTVKDILKFGTPDDWEKASQTVKATKQISSSTSTVKALKKMAEVFSEADKKADETSIQHVKFGFLLTDGQATDRVGLNMEDAVHNLADNLNVTMYGIGVGKACKGKKENGCIWLPEIELVAGSKNRTFVAKDYSHLENITKEFYEKICDDIDGFNLREVLKWGAGVIAAIVVASLVGVLILYAVQDYVRRKLELRHLDEEAEKLRKRKTEMNPIFINPVTTVTNPATNEASA